MFTELYESCGKVFPGRKSFMDSFREDCYQEWKFASWLLHSGPSSTAIDLLLSLDMPIQPKGHSKNAIHLLYWQPIECLQAILRNPLLVPYISFVPRKVWTSTTKICQVYDEWLTGDLAWNIQNVLPPGANILGVVLSSNKTSISIMMGNCMAYPLLISLANIDASIQLKPSLHGYLLLALLPIPKFFHKTTHVCNLNKVLAPLRIAATVWIMMNDPVGNLQYCYTPLASQIADTPEESLLLATNYKNFLKAIKVLHFNGVVKPVWRDWPLSDPSNFVTPKPLHHFQKMSWDQDTKWCISIVDPAELDLCSSLIQTTVGYCAFDMGISKLKQVTGHDHRAILHYIIGLIAGAVPQCFLVAVHVLIKFCYLSQAPTFTEDLLTKVAKSLQTFHDHKDTITHADVQSNWEILKMELLQSVVCSIRLSGVVIQWLADPMEHAHVQEIKAPVQVGNNQNYYNQIAHHLDCLEKCF
ncbi:hypothetical protein PAXRUDRAFT_34547 [Paxillus rubicundulus Ve08.2h10]|uniref:Uncharacterized protein n=1 Tax=Paxillus rubicundulus Ve08.2h10 TaxID=930991 RepID=A0A0D0DZD0_9AGAM|nr:hypothetical protein PAXRUDRAFT_34547 [Paxillus rubicundulus Ve08.2h10]